MKKTKFNHRNHRYKVLNFKGEIIDRLWAKSQSSALAMARAKHGVENVMSAIRIR